MQTRENQQVSAPKIGPLQGFLPQSHPQIDSAVAIEPFQPIWRNATHANVDPIDANLVATKVGISAELGLPHAVADDHSLLH